MIQFGPEIDRGLFGQTLDFAEKQVARLIDRHPGFYPVYTKNGRWKHDGPAWTHWCDGFLPGLMWIFHRRRVESGGQDGYWMDKAIEYTRPSSRASSTATFTISASSSFRATTAGTRRRATRS